MLFRSAEGRLHSHLTVGILLSAMIAFILVLQSGAKGVNSELTQMYDQDQSERMDVHGSDVKAWAIISAHDKVHRDRVLELMHQDKLETAEDYFHAALIMQHGDEPSDYMLAHIMSCAAAQMGNKPSVWLSAASFDRLMQKVGQSQVFGTQYRKDPSLGWTLQPLASEVLTDGVRKTFNVPTLEQSKLHVVKMNESKN
jgi:hypothetical protein